MAPPPDSHRPVGGVKGRRQRLHHQEPVNDVKHKRKLAVWVGLLTGRHHRHRGLACHVGDRFFANPRPTRPARPTAAVTSPNPARPTPHDAGTTGRPSPRSSPPPSPTTRARPQPGQPRQGKLAIDGDPATQWHRTSTCSPSPARAGHRPGWPRSTSRHPDPKWTSTRRVPARSWRSARVIATRTVKSAQPWSAARPWPTGNRDQLGRHSADPILLVWITTLAGGGNNIGSGIGGSP